jgi:hypothetical protein
VAIKGMALNNILQEEEIQKCAISWKNHSNKNILNEKILFSVLNKF